MSGILTMKKTWFSMNRNIFYLTLCTPFLFGCVTANPENGSVSQKPEDFLDSYIKAKGAAIVTRVSLADRTCLKSQVRLRKIVNGKLDIKDAVTIEQISAEQSGSYLSALKMRIGNMPILSRDSQKKTDEFLKNNPDSFSEITPGTYAVTWLKCEHKEGNIQLGADFPDSKDADTISVEPLIGANSIIVPKGQIIDGGILSIEIFVPDQTKPNQKKGRVKAVATPESQKNLLKNELPEIYKRIRFTTFSTYKGKL